MIYLIFVILLIGCIFDFYKKRKFYTPVFVFDFIWIITLGLYQLKLSTLQQDLSSRTLLIFLVCILSYNLTYFILMCINKYWNKSNKIKDKPKNVNEKKDNKLKEKIKNIFEKFPNTIEEKVKVAKWIAIIIFVIEIIYSGGLPLIWKITGDSKNYFDFGIPSLNGAWYGLIICLGAYSFFSKSKDKYLYLLIGILILSRQVLMSIVIEAVIFNILDKSKKVDVKKYLILGIIVFIAFNILGNIRSGSNEMNKVFKAKSEYENIPTSVKWVYSYMTFSISNFNNLVGKTNGMVNYGISTLKYLLPSVILKIFDLKENYKVNYLVSPNYNVSTYLPLIYLDFGIWGIAIFNIIIAVFGVWLYFNCTKKCNEKNRLLYSVFVHNIVFLFFNNMFLYLPIMIQILYIIIIFGEKEIKEDENKMIKDESI